MSITPLNIGSAPNDGNGQSLRSGGQIINDNFAELDLRARTAQEAADAKQPSNLKLSAIAASVWAANQLMYATGSGSVAMTPLTVAARALLDDADSPAMRVTLGLGGQILQALQALSMTANGLPYFASATTMAVATTTAFGRGLLALADAAALKSSAGLANADNTSDANKPISNATQAALTGKQAQSAKLDALVALTWSNNTMFVATSATAVAAVTTTAFGRGLLGVADGAAGRSALGALGVGQESIGIGQVWRDVAGRVIGTIYTNSTGRPIQLAILVSGTSGANVVPVITVGSVPIYGSYAQGANNYIPIPPVIVPPGATYRLTIGNGTATLTNWQEMSV